MPGRRGPEGTKLGLQRPCIIRSVLHTPSSFSFFLLNELISITRTSFKNYFTETAFFYFLMPEIKGAKARRGREGSQRKVVLL
jgi:hypothetical protein